MAILVDENTRVLVQGITGKQGRLHTSEMLKYGTKIVAGVTPGKGGAEVHGVKVYNSVDEALEAYPDINTSIVFVPAIYAYDAVIEAVDAGIKLIVVITEHIPVQVSLRMINYAKCKGSIIIGPNTPGIISPGKTKVGIMPGNYFKEGNIGIMSRSGTLTYEVSLSLLKGNMGVSTAVGIGGDPIVGTDFKEVYDFFLKDENTKAIIMIGEIGGFKEEAFATYYSSLPSSRKKPVIAYIAGKTAPPGKKMGHAGAIVYGKMGSYDSKVESLKSSGITVVDSFLKIPSVLEKII